MSRLTNRQEQIKAALIIIFNTLRDADLSIDGCGCCGSPWIAGRSNEGEEHNIAVPPIADQDTKCERIAKEISR